MKVLIDVKENRASSFMKLLESLDYINVLKELKSKDKNEAIEDIIEAFEDVKLHEKGKKILKSAQEVLNEI